MGKETTAGRAGDKLRRVMPLFIGDGGGERGDSSERHIVINKFIAQLTWETYHRFSKIEIIGSP